MPVSELGHFEKFEFEKGGIRAWKHRNIGMGTFIRASSFKDKGNGGKLNVEKGGDFFPRGDGTTPVGFWRITPATNAAACQMRDGDDDLPTGSEEDEEYRIFHCPVITCSASFNSKDALEDHILRNDHCSAALQYIMRDMSLRLFSGGIEGAIAHRIVIPEVDEALEEVITDEVDDGSVIGQGYALKKKKSSSRYSEKAKEYVEARFDEGITTGTKVPAEEGKQRMREAVNPDGPRMFSPEERLNARQIDSYYSRIKAERRYGSVKAVKKKGGKNCKRTK